MNLYYTFNSRFTYGHGSHLSTLCRKPDGEIMCSQSRSISCCWPAHALDLGRFGQTFLIGQTTPCGLTWMSKGQTNAAFPLLFVALLSSPGSHHILFWFSSRFVLLTTFSIDLLLNSLLTHHTHTLLTWLKCNQGHPLLAAEVLPIAPAAAASVLAEVVAQCPDRAMETAWKQTMQQQVLSMTKVD